MSQNIKAFVKGKNPQTGENIELEVGQILIFFLITKWGLKCVLGRIGRVLAVVWLRGGLCGRRSWTTLYQVWLLISEEFLVPLRNCV